MAKVDLLMAKEIIFLVEGAVEGGYTAQALGHSIFIEADTLEDLKEAVQDAIRCHFDEFERPLPVPVFKASQVIQERVEVLLERQQTDSLTVAEEEELDRYEEMDDYLSFVNRIVRNLSQ